MQEEEIKDVVLKRQHVNSDSTDILKTLEAKGDQLITWSGVVRKVPRLAEIFSLKF